MLGVFNFLIGIAMAAGEAFINPALKGATFIKNLGVDLLGASSEFIGDATQGFIGKVADKIKEHKEQKRLKDFINENLTNIQDENNTFHKIIQEIKIRQDEEEFERKGKRKSVHKASNSETDILNKDDIRAIMQMSTDLLFNNNITDYLIAYSLTFGELQERDVKSAEDFVQLIKITVNVYVKDLFYNSKDDFKVLAYVIVNALEERNNFCFTEEGYEELSDKLIQKLLPFLAYQNNGVINFQAVANAKFAPKYILRACPGCGYDGDRLFVDEKNGTVMCAACGGTYSLAQYIEPDLYTELIEKLKIHIDNNKSEIISKLTELDDKTKTVEERYEDINRQFNEIKDQLVECYSHGLTKDYLKKCLEGQADRFHNELESLKADDIKFKVDFNNKFNEIKAGLLILQSGQAEIKDILFGLKRLIEEQQSEIAGIASELDKINSKLDEVYENAAAARKASERTEKAVYELPEKTAEKTDEIVRAAIAEEFDKRGIPVVKGQPDIAPPKSVPEPNTASEPPKSTPERHRQYVTKCGFCGLRIAVDSDNVCPICGNDVKSNAERVKIFKEEHTCKLIRDKNTRGKYYLNIDKPDKIIHSIIYIPNVDTDSNNIEEINKTVLFGRLDDEVCRKVRVVVISKLNVSMIDRVPFSEFSSAKIIMQPNTKIDETVKNHFRNRLEILE